MWSIIVSLTLITKEENGLLHVFFVTLGIAMGDSQSFDYLWFGLKNFPWEGPVNYLFKMKPAIDLELNFG